MTDEVDVYQQRYLEHKKRKADMIAETSGVPRGFDIIPSPDTIATIVNRRSIRVFGELDSKELYNVFNSARYAPSSCNRQAISLVIVTGKGVADYLEGGKGWIHNAPFVFLLFSDTKAYKSPAEISFMPLLDAGVMLATLSLSATANGLASCIVNPKILPENELDFRQRFNRTGLLFVGALAIGKAGNCPVPPERKELREFVTWKV